MDPLTITGLAFSGLSLIDRFTGGGFTKLFGGKTDAQVREQRRNDYLTYIRQLKTNTLERENRLFQEGLRSVRQATTSAIEGSRQAGARRAKAMGRESDVESFVVPSEEKMAEAGAEAVKGYNLAGQRELSETAKYYDNLAAQGEYGFQQAPIDPNFGDLAGELGSALTQYGQTRETIKALETPAPLLPGPSLAPTPSRVSEFVSPQAITRPMDSDLLLGSDRTSLMSKPMTTNPNRPSFLNWSQKKRPLLSMR